MLAVLENPAVRARVMPCSVEHYHQLGDLGMLSERTELIRGAILEKMSQSALHGSIVERLRLYLEKAIPDDTHARQEKPLSFLDSEPEPDLAVVRGKRGSFLRIQPTTAEVVLEVSISSEPLDRLKLEIYAEAGIPECWLVFPETKVIERYTQVIGGRYQNVERAADPDTLASTVFPEIVLLPPDLFEEA